MIGTKPFSNAYGVWIKRTHYNNTTQNDRIDCVTNIDTGVVYVRKGGESGSWVTSNADIKKKNVSGSVTNYGNISLQLTTPSIVLGTRIIGNTGINSLPFINGTVWYAYMVRNTAGTTINFVESGTEVEVEVYYIDQ